MLPDVDEDSYTTFSRDEFQKRNQARVGAVDFQLRNAARIQGLGEIAHVPTTIGPQLPGMPQVPQGPLPRPQIQLPEMPQLPTPQFPSPQFPQPQLPTTPSVRPTPAPTPYEPGGNAIVQPPGGGALPQVTMPAQVSTPAVQVRPSQPAYAPPTTIQEPQAPQGPQGPPQLGGQNRIEGPTWADQRGGGDLQSYARQAAQRLNVDPDIFVAQINQESGFNPTARSPAGASGIAQIVPQYHPGVDTSDPYASLDYAAHLMRSNLDKYDGDYAKALAAYNAGGGNVDKYGGVPPFEETQRYVRNILGGRTTPSPTEGVTRAGAALGSAMQQSQFGDPELTTQEAYAACGPAAAVRFAQLYGRNPTLREAVDLASTVGWTESSGMAGIGSEQKLLQKLGVETRLVGGRQWDAFAREAATGNPITISTPGHYFYADGYNADTGQFHVGRSGLDLRGGKEWMTPAEMEGRMGTAQGALFASNPVIDAGSTSTSSPDYLDQMRDQMRSTLGMPKLGAQSLFQSSQRTGEGDLIVAQLDRAVEQAHAPRVQQELAQPAEPLDTTQPYRAGNPLEDLGNTIGSAVSNALSSVFGGLGGGPPGGERRDRERKGLEELLDPRARRLFQNPVTGEDITRDLGLPSLTPPKDLGEAMQRANEDILRRGSPLPGPGGQLGILDPKLGQGWQNPEDIGLSNILDIAGQMRMGGGRKGQRIADALEEGFRLARSATEEGRASEPGIGGFVRGATSATDDAARAAAERLNARYSGEVLPSNVEPIFDEQGRLRPKLTELEEQMQAAGWIDDETAPRLGYNAAGEIEARGTTRVPGREGLFQIKTSIPEPGAELAPPSAETLARMPNVAHLAGDMPDVANMIQRAAEDNPYLMDLYQQGRIPHSETVALAQDLGMTTDDFLNSPIGKAFNQNEQLALRIAVAQKKFDLTRMASEINRRGGLNALTDEERVHFYRHALDAQMLQAVGKGGGSTAGRTLNQQKIDVNRLLMSANAGANEERLAIAGKDAAETKVGRSTELSNAIDTLVAERTEARGNGVVPSVAKQKATRDAAVEAVKAATPLDQMTEVARLDREIINARRSGNQDALESLTAQRDDIVSKVRSQLEDDLTARLQAQAEQEPVAATMDNVYRAQGRRLLGFVRAEVDAALNPTTQARNAGKIGDDVHKAVLKALQKAAGEEQQGQKKLTDQLDRIDRLYSELEAYKAMSLEEKGADFDQRAAERAERAAKRAEALRNRSAPDELESALKDELAAERKVFSGSRMKWQEMAWEAEKRAESNAGARFRSDDPNLAKLQANAQKRGSQAWLEAQAALAKQEVEINERRAVAAFNKKSQLRERQVEAAGKIIEKLGGKEVTDKVLQQIVDAIDSGDGVLLAKTLKSLQKVNWYDRIAILRYASMLSSTATHAAQAAGSGIQLGTSALAHPFAVGADILASAATGDERTRYMAELPAMLQGGVYGLKGGIKDAAEILRSGINPAEGSRNIERGVTSFGINPVVDAAAEMPLRALEAGDAIFRGTARSGYARGLATRQAIREGFDGAARGARVDEIMRNLDDYPSLMEEATNAAKRVVLQEQRGGIQKITAGRGLQGFLQSMVMPFVRTPYNVAAQGLGMTPAGVVGVIEAAARGERGEAVDRVGRMMVGTGIMGGGLALAANGHLTGAMPRDASERSVLPPGWQPYSLKLNLPGKQDPVYIKYSNLGPVGVPLALAAVTQDTILAGKYVNPSDVVGRFVGGMGRFMIDSTMMQGMANVMDAIDDSEHKGENFLEGVVQQFVPYAALGRQIDRALGTSPRDVHGVMDSIFAQYPGLSGLVDERLDALGRPVKETQTGIGQFISPARYAFETDDPVLRELRMADVGIGQAPKAFRGIALTPEEQREFQRIAGEYITRQMPSVQAVKGYANQTPTQRQELLRRLVEVARTNAGGQIVRRFTPDEIRNRIAQERERTAPQPGVA